MRSFSMLRFSTFITMLFFFCSSSLISRAQDCGPITSTVLKQTLVQMGFDVKNINEAGKPDKFEIKNSSGGLDIPTGYEISASTNYIWLTVFLGKAYNEDSASRNTYLLQQNAVIQPCLFYITAKGNLMMGLPVENRAVTPAVLKRCNDFLTKRVAETKIYWQNQ